MGIPDLKTNFTELHFVLWIYIFMVRLNFRVLRGSKFEKAFTAGWRPILEKFFDITYL